MRTFLNGLQSLQVVLLICVQNNLLLIMKLAEELPKTVIKKF